ncbi:unnamed protein product, partial [Prunus brigantina]
MKKKYQGSTKVKRAQLQALRRDFEILHMKPEDFVDKYFSKMMAIASKMHFHGDKMDDVTMIEKILHSMSPKFNYVVCAIEEANNIETMSLDELHSSLLVHEQKFKSHDTSKEEKALKVSTSNDTSHHGEVPVVVEVEAVDEVEAEVLMSSVAEEIMILKAEEIMIPAIEEIMIPATKAK